MVSRLCFLLTGLSALVCEVCWIREASLTFGSSTWAISVVLAVFFAGLALGSYVVGRWSHRVEFPLKIYAWLEAGVAAWTWLTPWLFVLTDKVYAGLYASVSESIPALAITRLILVSLILLPATTMMGGSLPLFCQLIAGDRSGRITRSVGQLYGLNTLGAAIGAMLAGFYLIPTIGIYASLWLAGGINLTVSLLAFRIAHKFHVPLAEQPPQPVEQGPSVNTSLTADVTQDAHQLDARQRRTLTWVFFGIGLTAVAAEVLWTRYLSLWMPNTVYTYSLTLTIVLLGIVIGSWLAGTVSDRSRWRGLLIGLTQATAAIAIMIVMQWKPAWWGSWLNAISVGSQVLVVSAVMLLPSIMSGVAFPLAIGLMIDHRRQAGLQTGRMTAVNLIGGITGSVLVGFGTLPWLGLEATLYLVTGLGIVLALVAWFRLDKSLPRAVRWTLGVLTVAVWLGIPSVCQTRLPQAFLGVDGELVDFREGFNANVSVVKQGGVKRLEINRMWQGQDLKNHQIFAAHIPAILHPKPEDVLVIGLGTGQTASSFLTHGIQRLDCLEIEDGLIDLVRHHFDGQWMDDSRVHMVVEDGRNYVTHTDQRYDIISIEVGQIYRPRIASFYTADFYSRIKPRLKSDGLVCQFMPIEFFDPDQFRTLVATFRQVFPECCLWYNTSELLMIGSAQERLTLDLARFESLLASNPQLRSAMQYAYWGGPAYHLSRPESFLAGFLCGPAQLERISEGGQIYRDDRPYLEYMSVKPQSDAPQIVALLERQLTPLSLLVPEASAELVSRSHDIRYENLRETTARVLVSQADARLAGGDVEGALVGYRQAVQALPNYPPANLRLAELLQQQGDVAGAIPCYERVLAVKPDDQRSLLGLSQSLMLTGKFDQAEQMLRQLIAAQPQSLEAHTQLGWLLGQSGRHRDALVSFETALKIDDKASRALLGVANVLQTIGDAVEAQKVYREVLSIEPQMIEAQLGLGISLQSVRQYDAALECFQKVLEASANNVVALNSAAWILAAHPNAARRDPTLAIELADRAWQLTGGQLPETADALAAAHADQQRFERAVQIMDLALEAVRKLGDKAPGELLKQLEARRELYKNQQPYRLPMN